MKRTANSHLIDPRFVHKHKLENVLIGNLRRALPGQIPKKVLDEALVSNHGHNRDHDGPSQAHLGAEDVRLIKEYYVLRSPPDASGASPDGTANADEFYVLHNVPHSLEREDLKRFSATDLDCLKKYYIFNARKNGFLLSRTINEYDEIRIRSILKRKDMYMTEEEKAIVSAAIEKLPGILKESTYYATMFVDPHHGYFFEHHNKHVPGIMIIEGVRQFAVAIGHVYGKAPVAECALILQSMNAEFLSYLEINRPIRLKAVAMNVRLSRRGYWESSEQEISVIQGDAVAATFRVSGKAIPSKIYQRIRHSIQENDKQIRYFPLSTFYNKVIVRHVDKNIEYESNLNNVSIEGFCVDMDETIAEDLCRDPMEFTFCFEDVGFIFGQCQVVWQVEGESRNTAGFKIVSMSRKSKENLTESIKSYCFVVEERAYL